MKQIIKPQEKVTQNSEDYSYIFNAMKQDIKKLFKAMDDNTTSLWRDDLECTHECIVIEDVDDGVKMDENDNPITPCKGSDVLNMMEYITAVYLK